MAKRFEEETGIKVQMQVLQAGQIRKKQDIMLAGKDPDLDIVMLQMDNRGGKLTAAGHLEDLQPYLDDPSLTPAGYDYPGDWLGGCLNTAAVITGQPLNNIVWSAQAQLLHIRKDLFEKHNVKVPTTMAELEDAAKKLTIDEDGDGKPEIYGFLSRGHGRLTTASFATYLFNHGGSWFKRLQGGTKVSSLDSKESIGRVRVLRAAHPRVRAGIRAQHQAAPERGALRGRQGGHAVRPQFLARARGQPEEVAHRGQEHHDPRPGRPRRQLPQRADHVARNLQVLGEKKAAWLYIAWMTQQHIMLDGQMAAVPMCRRSSWVDPTYVAPTPAWGELAKIAADLGIAIAKPQAIAIGQMRDAAGEIVNVAIRDGSREAIEAEAKKQAAFMTQLVAETEKGMEFAGVIPRLAKKLDAQTQAAPIRAEGLDKLGM